MNLYPSRSLPFVILPALFLFSSCGGTKATPPVDPGPTPTIAPTATPPPAAPTDPRITKSCEKFKAGSASAKCGKSTPAFQAEVDAAITLLQHQKPEIFDGNTVLSPGQFVVGVIKNLDAEGICGFWDGEELAVKNADWFNDQYDIITSRNTAWFGPNNYMTTCEPAAFPLPLPGMPGQVPGCSVAPSREIYCGKDPQSQYVDLVDTAIGNALVQHPQCFDPKDTPPASDYAKILNWDCYLNAVTKELNAKGLCTFYDGEELQVKGTADRSEHFDIVMSSMHIRRGSGMYESSCYPAAF